MPPINRYKCRPASLIRADDLVNHVGLIGKLRDARDPLSYFFRERLSPNMKQMLDEYNASSPPSEMLQKALVDEINCLYKDSIHRNRPSFADKELEKLIDKTFYKVWESLKSDVPGSKHARGNNLIRLIRRLLEEVYPLEIWNNSCGFALPEGWGGWMYVIDDSGKRIYCSHPGEIVDIERVLGKGEPLSLFKARIGFNSDCLCLDCLHEFAADLRDEVANPFRSHFTDATYWWKLLNATPLSKFLSARIKNLFSSLFHSQPPSVEEKDKRQCPKCNSANVKTVFELIGQPCPICKKGVIEEIKTGKVC